MNGSSMGCAALAVRKDTGDSAFAAAGKLAVAGPEHEDDVVVMQIETLDGSINLAFRRGEFNQMLASGAAVDVAVSVTSTEAVDERDPERSSDDDRDAWEYPSEAEAGTPVEDPA